MAASIMDEIDTSMTGKAKIKVIGVGGGGGNAIKTMINADLLGVEFICANTDMQALGSNDAPIKVQLGEKLTKGLGAGANPQIGRDAALESDEHIKAAIADADMVFVTAGMGGGTGTGAAPVIAKVAKDMDKLTVGVVTKPFSFEAAKRKDIAEQGLEELKKHVDCLIIIPNDRLLCVAPKKMPVKAMFQLANDVLLNAVRGISDVIMREGLINLDFADVRTTMSQTGRALMGTGIGRGENRAKEATIKAISSPLLEDVSLESAKSILYNITASDDINVEEITEIGNIIHEACGREDINIIFGVVMDPAMGEDLQVTLIATGIDPKPEFDEEPQIMTQSTVTPFPVKKTRPTGRPQSYPSQGGEGESEDNWQNSHPGQRRSNQSVDGNSYEDPSDQPFPRHRDYRSRANVHAPGSTSFHYNENDLEVPAFLRYQAD